MNCSYLYPLSQFYNKAMPTADYSVLRDEVTTGKTETVSDSGGAGSESGATNDSDIKFRVECYFQNINNFRLLLI